MASASRPAASTRLSDTDTAYQFGTGETAVFVWFDPRGGINVQADDSLHIHTRTGRSLRIITGIEDYARNSDG